MKVNIMLIDDSIIDLFINEKNIEKLKIDSKIKTFTSGVSAIDYLEKTDDNHEEDLFIPDFILLDVNMPKMNAFQFMNQFRKLDFDKFKNIKIYMLSASNNTKFINNAKSGRFSNGYIEKPLTVGKLENMLKDFEPSPEEFQYQESDLSLVIN